MQNFQNFLYYGDNLDILQRYIGDETVDLIYLDPPFKSNQNYNVLFQERNGSRSKAQIKVFEDTWQWDQEAACVYQEIVEKGPQKVSKVMQAFQMFLGNNDMLAYLSMMAPRLVELKRVLKPTGSIYLHCDPTTSHYLKLLMDAVFGPKNFQNEIVWFYRRWTATTGRFQRMHDVILFYGKQIRPRFNPIYVDTTEGQKKKHERGWDRNSVIIEGRRQPQLIVYNKARVEQAVRQGRINLSDYARVVEVEVRKTIAPDVWQINYINSQAKERLGYPTQKPEALLERIIKASSNEADVVLDPFCGCGTTISVAQKLNRRWIGIDITHLAIGLIRHRLQDTFGSEISSTYQVIGEPTDLASAETLAKEDPYQFQWWALGLVGARPVEQKTGADEGIDGRIYFHDEVSAKLRSKQIIISVKSGHVASSDIRDLRGVLEREKADIGVFITLQKPSRPMRREAVGAGFYVSPGWNKRYPRIQILTIEELLQGKTIGYPAPKSTDVTFKKAPRFTGKRGEQKELF